MSSSRPIARILLWILALLAIFSSGSEAQVSGYSSQDFLSEWTPVGPNATPFTYTNVQNGFGDVTLPFNFVFDDSVFYAGNLIRACANGVVSFSGYVAPDSNVLGVESARGMLCIMSGNLTTGDAGNIHDSSEVTGMAPNRVLTIQFHGVHYPKSGAGHTGTGVTAMQVKLYETTNVIEFIYRDHDMSFSDTSTSYCGIGLNGGLKGPFTAATYIASTRSTPAMNIRWTPPSSWVVQADDGSKNRPAASLAIFPCPAKSTICLPAGYTGICTLVDARGSLRSLPIAEADGTSMIDVRAIPNGYYRLCVTTSKGTASGRIIINH